jgi:hypothetical protein
LLEQHKNLLEQNSFGQKLERTVPKNWKHLDVFALQVHHDVSPLLPSAARHQVEDLHRPHPPRRVRVQRAKIFRAANR